MIINIKKFTAIIVLFIATALFPMSSSANNSAHGLWGVGVQLGMLEYGASQNADPGFLVRALNQARELAVASECIPTDEIDSLIAAMSRTSSSRSLYSRILEYRLSLGRYVLANCDCSGQSIGATFDLSGTWVFGSGGQTWTFTPLGNNRYRARETGYGNATGTAEVKGRKLRLDFTYSGGSGHFEGTISADGTSIQTTRYPDKARFTFRR